MRVYAHEPPWSGRYGDYGWWKRGEEMWDGSGYEWIWQPPLGGTLWKVSGILADYYLPALQRELNRELSIITEWKIEQGTQLPRTAAAEMAYEHEGFGGQQEGVVRRMNWQNIPAGLEVVRRAVVPKGRGGVLNSFDYSKIEPRLLAYFASKKGDDTLASYLRQGRDPYRAVVAGMYGKSEHELTEKEYKSGKILFLSLMYGGGIRTVEAQHGVGRNEAKAMIKKFHTAWPIVRELQDDVVRIANRRGYIKTPWGRRLHLEEYGEHKLLNKLIQGSAAHLLKLSLVRVHDHLKANPERRSHLVLTIHDELVLDGPLAETHWLHETIPPLMDDPIISAVVPILVDHEISPTHWAERIDYDDWASMEAGKAA